jgi:hypothetical protein
MRHAEIKVHIQGTVWSGGKSAKNGFMFKVHLNGQLFLQIGQLFSASILGNYCVCYGILIKN